MLGFAPPIRSPVTGAPWREELLSRAKEIDETGKGMGGYAPVLPILQSRIEQLVKEFGEEKTCSFLGDALDMDAINWWLRNKAVEKAGGWMSSPLYSREKLLDAAKAFNLALYETGDPNIRILLQDFFFHNDNENGGVLRLARWQLWKLPNYAKQCDGAKQCKDRNIVFYAFMKHAYIKMGDKPVDFTELVDLALAVPENTKEIFEGKTPEATDWFARAQKMQAQVAEEIRPFLTALAAGCARTANVELQIGGDEFSVGMLGETAGDGWQVNVPAVVNRFPSKGENRRDYTLIMYHECEGHVRGRSFEIDVLEAEAGKLGFRICDPHLLTEKSEYVEMETLDGRRVVRDEDAKGFRLLSREEMGLKRKEPYKFKVTNDLLELFGDDEEFAQKMMNIVEDRRIDEFVMRNNPGICDEYRGNKEKHLHFRNRATDDNDPGHVLEAFLQLAIVPLNPGEIKERMDAVGKELEPLQEARGAGQQHDKERLAYLERQNSELKGLLERHAALMKMPRALELTRIAERAFDAEDGTPGFNVTIEIVDRFKKWFPNYLRYVKIFDAHLLPENISGLRKARLKVRRLKPEKAGEGERKPGENGINGNGAGKKGKTRFQYDEWDYSRKRNIWRHTTVVEEPAPVVAAKRPPHPVTEEIVAMFRRLKPQEKTRKRGCDEGDEIDPMLYTDYLARLRAGLNPDPLYWTRYRRNRRSVASALIIDCSGSTEGEVLRVELQASDVLSKAIEEVGDPFAVWAFNSESKDCTHFYIIKDFGEPVGNRTVCSDHANRDGAAMRHATKKLLERKERSKVLFILADGFPADTNYEGEYAMADTRRAVEEAAAKGIIVFCIAVRMGDNDVYKLTKIYGEGRVFAIRNVKQLPGMLPFFYRQVTRLGA